MGGDSSRALNAVTIAITAALGGQTDLQAVSNALAPYAAQVIGQEFGHGEDKNTAAQLVAHALLGATLAYINGGDPTAGGSAAVASEAAAMYFTKQLEEKYRDDPKYFVNGEFQANLLSETEKAQIRDLTAGIGAVIGGAAGDSSYNAQLAGVIGQNAVENNYLTATQIRYYDLEMQQCKTKSECDQVVNKYRKLSIAQDEKLDEVCRRGSKECINTYIKLLQDRNEVFQAIDTANNIPWWDKGAFNLQQVSAITLSGTTELAKRLQQKYKMDDQQAQLVASAILGGLGAGKAIRSKPAVNNRTPVPEAIKASNGLTYKSNSKHTLGGEGNRPNAGIEPKNSLELFEKSIAIGGNSNKRFTLDSNGHVHQFTYEGSGSKNYHWAGSTADARNPLNLDNGVKAELRKNGWKSKVLK